MCDSPGLVDFPVWQVDSIVCFPDEQVNFFFKFVESNVKKFKFQNNEKDLRALTCYLQPVLRRVFLVIMTSV